ncbi:transglycosylase domain-containing protein [Streptomyces sp. NA02950]|uniref:transglycosylase domain-containing protein n=1 Tax=Streptomyces sp. NA02950 TaxID=2742137 RepID=UPI0015916684|nr:transglycosylase domain-containing protein [Streptomyces sp. NA02950]QKV90983.1 transglycosylase domain-containing protein [Streptomyces sp. NA02950]
MTGPLTALRARRSPDQAEAREETRTAGAGRPRRSRRKRPVRRTGIRRFFTWRRVLAYVVSLLALLIAAFTVLYYAIDIPRANAQAKAQSNVYRFSDGTILARTGEINRETVPLSQVPKPVQRAFVAAENKSFYQDSGVDPMGVLRGLVNTVAGKGTQGGSTITQQYVKNYYLSQEQTVTRKIKELVISLKVDQRNAKDDILAGYLNTSYFGRVAYGIQAAARAYYDKEVGDLTVEEGAYLAALVQAPSQYDWAVASPKGRRLVVQRWNYVLNNMVGTGWLDRAKRQRMRFPMPVAPKPAPGLGGQAGYLVDTARNELIASGVSEQELAAGGWTITLNIDRAKQRALEKSMAPALGKPGSSGEPRGNAANTQGGAVSMDPRNGRILALYGGRDYTKHYMNNATRGDYQVGPVFEPVSLAAVLEGERRADTRPGSPATVRRTAGDLGMDTEGEGFRSPQSLRLGLMGASPLRMAGVYASLDHHGKQVTPSLVKSAQRGDERAELPRAVGDQAVERATADAVTGTLTDGDGPPAARAVKRPVAGSAGVSDDKKASWFIGYTPELVTSMALFGENGTTRKQIRLADPGTERVASLWSSYTEEALRETPSSGFDLGPETGTVVPTSPPEATGTLPPGEGGGGDGEDQAAQ